MKQTRKCHHACRPTLTLGTRLCLKWKRMKHMLIFFWEEAKMNVVLVSFEETNWQLAFLQTHTHTSVWCDWIRTENSNEVYELTAINCFFAWISTPATRKCDVIGVAKCAKEHWYCWQRAEESAPPMIEDQRQRQRTLLRRRWYVFCARWNNWGFVSN